MSALAKKINKWHVRGLVFAAIAILGMLVLSGYHYRSFETNPLTVWHGANMGVRSLLLTGGKRQSQVQFDIGHIRERLKQRPLDQLALKPTQHNHIDIKDTATKVTDVKNQIASIHSQDRQRQQKVAKLQQAKQQLLNTKLTLDTLNLSGSVGVYKQVEAARRAHIQAASNTNIEVPSEEDAKTLVLNRGRSSNKLAGTIPQTVLDNIQQTTGISPDEISELMNR
jgi:hypothetical protein